MVLSQKQREELWVAICFVEWLSLRYVVNIEDLSRIDF